MMSFTTPQQAANAGAGMLSREPTGNEAENLRGKVLCLVKKVPKTLSLISTLLALLFGFLGFYLGQNLDPIDALYLTIVTISTVGYGDISPSDACIDDEGNDISGSSACVGKGSGPGRSDGHQNILPRRLLKFHLGGYGEIRPRGGGDAVWPPRVHVPARPCPRSQRGWRRASSSCPSPRPPLRGIARARREAQLCWAKIRSSGE